MSKKAKSGMDIEAVMKYSNLSIEDKNAYKSEAFLETKKIVDFSIKNPNKDIEECYSALLKDGSIIEP